MPLDFNTTKRFRDFVLSKTLQVPNGPQTFTENNYSVKNLNESPNVDPGAVDTNRTNDLLKSQNANIFKPLKYNIVEELNVIPRRANLSLYYSGTPYFVAEKHTLVGIMSNQNYDNESELFKFAASYIQDKNQKGPVYSRIQQNLYKSTIGRIRLLDALNGNLATATNIVTGREPLVESNYQITVGKTPIGKGIDFLQTVSGIEFPWSEIPGDYLSNPTNPINVRPVPNTEFGKIFQDTTGALGSLLGIQRKPTRDRKPSDLFVEYMGSGQKQTLYDLLSYSKYAPNYTTTARSQNTSRLFNFVDNFAQGAKSALGVEAPNSNAYIGDDRGDDVKYAMNDFNDRPVRSPYYLSLLFDPIQTELFEIKKNISEGGQISGKLTWISINSKNKLGANNSEYDSQRSQFEESLSTKHNFRDDSLLGYTQDILDSMPTNGGEARSHISNVIDQTTRIFREGNTFLSRGSAIQYVDSYGQQSGVEYCRVWTKDRPYATYSDTMKKGGNIRKFEGSVVQDPWNINIAPMSNGKKEFPGGSNIVEGYKYGPDADGKNFYAKKYMFSIENLAWRTSDRAGFTVLDLPLCERGPSGGRVMWFPPYDLKVSENNQASWESNTFLGRPEPIYTYKNTERTGQISFKIVVDHPSILNLLVREEFKDMSDNEADNYINALFAGCKDLDFYDLIRRYTTLSKSDVENIKAYLNKGGSPEVIKQYSVVADKVEKPNPNVVTPSEPKINNDSLSTISLNFSNAIPGVTGQATTQSDYTTLYNDYVSPSSQTTFIDRLTTSINQLNAKPANDKDANSDRKILFNSTTGNTSAITSQITKYFTNLTTNFNAYTGKTTDLKAKITEKKAQEIVVNINASTSSADSDKNNFLLSLRRSYSLLIDFLKRISKDGNTLPSSIKWASGNELTNDFDLTKEYEYKLKDLGWTDYDTTIKIKIHTVGENNSLNTNGGVDNDCWNKDFKSVRDLNKYSPISFYCRRAEIDFKYNVKDKPVPPPNPESPKITPKYSIDVSTLKTQTQVKRPPIDVMKRIIMKTLSECHYFKKLEEDSPLVFKSLREKLRYFHPAFHSTTPEGLNSRLTFLHQCIRPGDTIPIKGRVDDTDVDARNTTFGPPPICVLRIGDFYHSKIVIRDVNISYDDSNWDLNPEGIGMQPMLASVTMSINFIGGQGLEEPVAKLQNALSSNFYANTEIYDERATPTNTKIDGKDANKFTKEFLEKFDLQTNEAKPETLSPTNVVTEGKYIGETNFLQIDYTMLVLNIFENTKNYFKEYKTLYNIIVPMYGKKIANMVLSTEYRTINQYVVTKGDNSTINIPLFGLYKKGFELSKLIETFKIKMSETIGSSNLCSIFGFDKEISPQSIDRANRLLIPYIKNLVNNKLTELNDTVGIKNFENKRNTLITSLDKVNFIVKYERDFTIDKEKYYEVELSGFTRNLLYKEYSYCIDYIIAKSTTMYADLDNTINFINPTITTNDLSDILSVLVQKDKENILNLFIGTFDDKTILRLSKKLVSFIVEPKQKIFTFDKFKDRTNDNQLMYEISTKTETTDENMISDGKKINSSVVDVKTNLNFYKIKTS